MNPKEISRRDFLRLFGRGAVALSGAVALGGCGPAANEIVKIAQQTNNNPVIQDIGDAVASYGDIAQGKPARIEKNANGIEAGAFMLIPVLFITWAVAKLRQGAEADSRQALQAQLDKIQRRINNL